MTRLRSHSELLSPVQSTTQTLGWRQRDRVGKLACTTDHLSRGRLRAQRLHHLRASFLSCGLGLPPSLSPRIQNELPEDCQERAKIKSGPQAVQCPFIVLFIPLHGSTLRQFLNRSTSASPPIELRINPTPPQSSPAFSLELSPKGAKT